MCQPKMKRLFDRLQSSQVRNVAILLAQALTQDQYRILSADLNLISVLEIEGDKRVVSTLVDQEQLEELHKVYEPRSRSWRGQYQVLSKAIVTEYEKVLKG